MVTKTEKWSGIWIWDRSPSRS